MSEMTCGVLSGTFKPTLSICAQSKHDRSPMLPRAPLRLMCCHSSNTFLCTSATDRPETDFARLSFSHAAPVVFKCLSYSVTLNVALKDTQRHSCSATVSSPPG